jgi:hypothetical protein
MATSRPPGTRLEQTYEVPLNLAALGAEEDMRRLMLDLSNAVIDEANTHEDVSGKIGITMQQFDSSIKYALIHHAATKGAVGMYHYPLCADSLRWGIDMAGRIAGWKNKKLHSRVFAGEFHRWSHP